MILDCIGQLCPQPVIALARFARTAAPGTRVEIFTDDPAAVVDIPAWCRMRGHECVCTAQDGDRRTHVVTIRDSPRP